MTDERYLEVAAAAKRVKKCQETIRRYIRAGRLRAIRADFGAGTRGGNWLIPESALDDLVATSCNISQHQPE